MINNTIINDMVVEIGNKKKMRHFIREWMKYRGLNQATIANRLEVERSTISKLLSGQMRLSDIWLIGFAEALDVEVGDLFRDPKRPTQDELLAGLSDDDQIRIRLFADMLRKVS